MRAVSDRFHDQMALDREESTKVFLFVVKAFAAMGFLFVLGQVAATGTLTTTLLLVLALSTAVDLIPEMITIRMMGVIPDAARRAEKLQLLLKAAAYLILASVVAGLAPSAVWGYAAFTVLWLASFLVEESVMFLLEDMDR